MSEHRIIPDWEWLEKLLGDYNITEKRTGLAPKRDFSGIEASLYTEIQKRYTPRSKPNYIDENEHHTSKEYENSKKIHGVQIATMQKMGYGLLLDGFTFYKIGHELEPWNYETNFTMHHAYEIHRLLEESK